MSDIKVGEYIRFKRDGIISKIPNEDMLLTYKKWEEDGIIKHSPNIIDLIEVGDYVNGYKVADINEGGVSYFDEVEGQYYDIDEIKSIVTKEQFEESEYKVC